MSELLHELENNEAILLMYIAGELPEDERREVEGMLRTDAGLRALHDELRSAWEGAMRGVEAVDAADGEPPLLSRDVAARRVGRMVRQWHTARVARASEDAARLASARELPRRAVNWWVRSGLTAAALLVGFLVWWGMVGEPLPKPYRGGEFAAVTPSPLDPAANQTTGVPPDANPDGAVAINNDLTDGVEFDTVAVDPTGFAAGKLGGDVSISRIESELDHLKYLAMP